MEKTKTGCLAKYQALVVKKLKTDHEQVAMIQAPEVHTELQKLLQELREIETAGCMKWNLENSEQEKKAAMRKLNEAKNKKPCQVHFLSSARHFL